MWEGALARECRIDRSGRAELAAFGGSDDVRVRAGVVDEASEALEFLRVADGIGPFALVGVDDGLHLPVELLIDAEAVLQDHLLEVVQAAFQILAPYRGALQAVGGADVEHQEAVDGAVERCIVEVGGEQLGMARAHAAVAADVEVPAVLGGDHADVLALSLGALSGAAGHPELDLVGRAQALVAVLEPDRHAHAVLHAVAAPGAAHAGLHRAQRLAVGVAGLEAGLDQLAPDCRQVLQAGPEQVDALAAGHLGVERVLLRHLA